MAETQKNTGALRILEKPVDAQEWRKTSLIVLRKIVTIKEVNHLNEK